MPSFLCRPIRGEIYSGSRSQFQNTATDLAEQLFFCITILLMTSRIFASHESREEPLPETIFLVANCRTGIQMSCTRISPCPIATNHLTMEYTPWNRAIMLARNAVQVSL